MNVVFRAAAIEKGNAQKSEKTLLEIGFVVAICHESKAVQSVNIYLCMALIIMSKPVKRSVIENINHTQQGLQRTEWQLSKELSFAMCIMLILRSY